MASAPPYDPSIDYATLGYGPDMPGQNVMQGMPQTQAGPTDLLSQIQPQAVDPNAVPQAAPADPNAAPPPANILQQAVQPQPGADRLGTVQPSQNFGQPGTYVPPQVAPPRQRASFIDFLGKLGERINQNFGDHYGDHAYARQELARTNAITDATKLQDLAQTGVATQQNANQLVNTFANGLKSIKDAGGNLAASAPALAQQLGIPPQQAQAILNQEQQTPGFIDNLAAATESAAKGGKTGRELALALTQALGPDGKPVFLQAGADGQPHPLAGYSPIPALGTINTGTGEAVYDKKDPTAKIIKTITKSGAPESGTVATGTDANGNPTYAPLPGSLHQANVDKAKAETDKVTAANQAAAEKARATATAEQQKQRAVQDNLKSLEAGIYKLRDLGALNSAAANPVGNVVNAFQATGVGQAVSHVTNPNVAAARDQIKAAANGILLNMSAGRSQMFRTNAEQTRALQAINNPQSSLPVMLQALKAFKDAATPAAPAAAPAAKAPAPKGTWGKAQVVQ